MRAWWTAVAWLWVLGMVTACATARPPAPGPAPGAGTEGRRAPGVAVGWEQTGRASWYGTQHHGRKTASGEIYDMHALTAAHRTLPLGTRLEVLNVANGKSVEVRVNDRGPFVDGRIVDLSYAAAERLDALGTGVISVRIRVVALPSA